MRILHLVSYPIYSGPIPSTLGLGQAQRAAGHKVWLAYDSKRGAFNEFEEAASPRVDPCGFALPEALTLSTKSTWREIWADRAALKRQVAELDIDIVHCHLSHDHTLVALSGLPPSTKRVRTLHSERSLRSRFGQNWLMRRADAWIVRCQGHQQALLNNLTPSAKTHESTAARVKCIPGGIDASAFVPANPRLRALARERFGVREGAQLVVHVALIDHRGQEELAGALLRVNSSNLHVLYVGRGRQEKGLRLMAKAAGLRSNAHFAGYLQGDELRQAYAAADVAFLGKAGNDASVRAALEAMASGLPIVAVQDGALAELVNDDVGYGVESCRSDAIAVGLKAWLSDPTADGKGIAARQLMVKERSFEGEAASTLAHYESVLAQEDTSRDY